MHQQAAAVKAVASQCCTGAGSKKFGASQKCISLYAGTACRSPKPRQLCRDVVAVIVVAVIWSRSRSNMLDYILQALHCIHSVLQGLQADLGRLAQAKEAGLEKLKQLSEQQQQLHNELSQAQQESNSSNRQLERLQRENQSLQASS